MISEVIKSLKVRDQWKVFVAFFKAEETNEIMTLLKEAPVSSEALARANARIALFQELSKLDNWTQMQERKGGDKVH